MAIRSGKDIRDQLMGACCKCKQVRETVERQRVLREIVAGGEAKPAAEVTPSSSFSAVPNKG